MNIISGLFTRSHGGKQTTLGPGVSFDWDSVCLPSPGGCTQFSVEVGVDKPGVGVVLHQAVDFPLRCQEARRRGLAEALDDGVFGVEVQVYLFGSFAFNELLVNAAGLGRQLLARRVVLEVLTGRPKLDVLLAELRLQEDAKGGFPVFITEECVK